MPAVLDWTAGRGVDTTFDTVGGDTFCRSFAATKVYGNVVTLLQTACDADAVKHARLRNQSIHYELMLTPLYLGLHAARVAQRHILEEGANLIEQGRLKVHVSRELAPGAGCRSPPPAGGRSHHRKNRAAYRITPENPGPPQ